MADEIYFIVCVSECVFVRIPSRESTASAKVAETKTKTDFENEKSKKKTRPDWSTNEPIIIEFIKYAFFGTAKLI